MGKVEDALRGLINYHGKRAAREVVDDLPGDVRENRRQLRSLRREVRELKEQVATLMEERREQMDVPPAPEEEVKDARFSTKTLKRIRRKFSLTQAELAELLDVSHATITAWENGKARPRKVNIARIVTLRDMTKREVDEALGRDSTVGRWRPAVLKNLRRKFALRQDELAKLLGVSVASISGWETGRSQPTRRNLKAIAELREMPAAAVNRQLGRTTEDLERPRRRSTVKVRSVREIRKQAGLSQGEMGKKLGVSGTTISNWESGKTHPRAANARKLLKMQRELDASETESNED